MRLPRPCIDCNKLHTDKGDYCSGCRRQRERIREADPRRKAYKSRLYNAEYQRLAKMIRANAVTCHLCNEGARVGDPWTADHVTAGDVNSPLLPAHRSCNSSKGNR
jgi:predicted Fe-S protein YdhL (DUF1289 family)